MRPTFMQTTLAVAGSLTLAGVIMALTLSPQPGEATPQFTQQTGKPCGYCHTQPPALNDNGKKFKANGRRF